MCVCDVREISSELWAPVAAGCDMAELSGFGRGQGGRGGCLGSDVSKRVWGEGGGWRRLFCWAAS